MSVVTQEAIFSDASVFVSSTRVIISGTTYPTANITSVRSFSREPSRTGPGVLILIGLISLITRAWGVAFIFCAAGVTWWVLQKTAFTVLIGTAGGEHQALNSNDGKYVDGIVSAINEAIVARG
jgi:ABC-type uncharacterized transport system permease subunit